MLVTPLSMQMQYQNETAWSKRETLIESKVYEIKTARYISETHHAVDCLVWRMDHHNRAPRSIVLLNNGDEL